MKKSECAGGGGDWQGKLLIAALVVVLLTVVGSTYGKEVEDNEVPQPVIEEEVKGSWWMASLRAVQNKLSEKAALNDEITALNIQLQQANAKLLGFDSLLGSASKQNDRTVSHFESLLAARDRDIEAFRNQNEILDEAVKNLEAKESNMIFVEGCWIPINSVQDNTQ